LLRPGRDLVAELGPLARAATAAEAATAGDLVVVSVPVLAFSKMPSEALAGRVTMVGRLAIPAGPTCRSRAMTRRPGRR
jgi:predicted dinucleotide-binding enzyme